MRARGTRSIFYHLYDERAHRISKAGVPSYISFMEGFHMKQYGFVASVSVLIYFHVYLKPRHE